MKYRPDQVRVIVGTGHWSAVYEVEADGKMLRYGDYGQVNEWLLDAVGIEIHFGDDFLGPLKNSKDIAQTWKEVIDRQDRAAANRRAAAARRIEAARLIAEADELERQ